MGEITKMDLLVHPFFTLYCSNVKISGRTTEEEAKIFLETWKKSIDEIREDESRILIFVSNLVKEEEFESIKAKRRRTHLTLLVLAGKRRSTYEAELLAYAYERLRDRLFLYHSTLKGKDLARTGLDLNNPGVYVYGEWISACCMSEAEVLSEELRIPRENFKFFPKKSLDAAEIGYPSKKELEEIMKLPRKERIKIIRERMKVYTKELNDFRKSI